MSKNSDSEKRESIRETVRQAYAQIAAKGKSCCSSGQSCCASASPTDLAKGIGYSDGELANLPEEANMGLSCGNPTAIAALKPGEVVLDLGAGGGFDVFIAARKVGRKGRVIGVDMTPEMVAKARRNAPLFAERTGLDNVEFRLGEIEHLPVADNSMDVIMSNCVINLSPEKQQVFDEAFRVLRPGGRLAIADVVQTKPFKGTRWEGKQHLSTCISGSATVKQLETMLRKAGFAKVNIKLNEASRKMIRDWDPGTGVENYICSAFIEARK